MIGLDTSAIIDIMKGNNDIKALIEKNQEDFAATMMSYLELSFGLDIDNKKHKNEEEKCDELFKRMNTFNFNKASCKKSAEIFWQLKKTGAIIEKNDCTIVGIFLTNGIKRIITKNKEHFKRIKEIETISY